MTKPIGVHNQQQVTKVDQAKTQIILHHPFYASILLKRPLIETTQVPTAAVNAKGQIYYNPDWFDSLSVAEIMFVLCHECMHYMWMHAVRIGHRDPIKWNMAGDGVINETLIACRVGEMPEHGVRWENGADLSAEQIYDLMPDPPQQNEAGSGDGDGESGGSAGQGSSDQQDGDEDGEDGGGSPGDQQGDGQPQWGIGNDIDLSEQLDEHTVAEIEAEVKVDIVQAANAAKQMGKMPAVLARFVDQLLHVETPWYEHLYSFFTRLVEDDISWDRMDRRFLARGIKLPWFSGEGLAKIALISDESGSVSDAEQREFCGHLNTILDTCTPEELFLLHVDTKVHRVDTYTPDDYPVKIERVAAGGTDMTAGIYWVCEHHPDVDAIIVLTDGYTPFGEDPGIPTFWAMTSDVVAPWGQTVQLKLTD